MFISRLRKPLALTLTVAALLCIHAGPARADEQPAQLARHELWLSWSATLLLGGIAGSFALKAAALDERVDALPRNVRERPEAQADALNTWRWAWGFGSAASLMALTSVLVWVYQPALPARSDNAAAALSPVIGAGQLGIHFHGRF